MGENKADALNVMVRRFVSIISKNPNVFLAVVLRCVSTISKNQFVLNVMGVGFVSITNVNLIVFLVGVLQSVFTISEKKVALCVPQLNANNVISLSQRGTINNI